MFQSKLCYYTTALFCFCCYIKHTHERPEVRLRWNAVTRETRNRCAHASGVPIRWEQKERKKKRVWKCTEGGWPGLLRHFNGQWRRARPLVEDVLPGSTQLVLMWNFYALKKRNLINLREYSFLIWWIETPKLNYPLRWFSDGLSWGLDPSGSMCCPPLLPPTSPHVISHVFLFFFCSFYLFFFFDKECLDWLNTKTSLGIRVCQSAALNKDASLYTRTQWDAAAAIQQQKVNIIERMSQKMFQTVPNIS